MLFEFISTLLVFAASHNLVCSPDIYTLSITAKLCLANVQQAKKFGVLKHIKMDSFLNSYHIFTQKMNTNKFSLGGGTNNSLFK